MFYSNIGRWAEFQDPHFESIVQLWCSFVDTWQLLAEWLCRYCWGYLSSCLIHLHTSQEPLILDVYSSTSGIFFTSELKICISYVVIFFILIPFCDCFVQLKWKITRSLFFRSVNFKFVPEPIFVSKAFAISLLIAHLVLLAAFAHNRWCK